MSSDDWGEPPPKASKGDLWREVIADMESRRKHGIDKYGTPLQAFNGRNALKDAYEEVLDLAVYLKQALVELEEGRAALSSDQASASLPIYGPEPPEIGVASDDDGSFYDLGDSKRVAWNRFDGSYWDCFNGGIFFNRFFDEARAAAWVAGGE